MNAPKSLLKLMHEVEVELQEFCNKDWIKDFVSLIKKKWCGFSVKSQESEHLWVTYENVYIAFNLDYRPSISFSTSWDDNTSDSKRFKEDENSFSHLLRDLKKLKR